MYLNGNRAVYGQHTHTVRASEQQERGRRGAIGCITAQAPSPHAAAAAPRGTLRTCCVVFTGLCGLKWGEPVSILEATDEKLTLLVTARAVEAAAAAPPASAAATSPPLGEGE